MSKYFKYQQIDSVTGVSAAISPSENGLKHADLSELKVISFSKDGVWVYAEAGETAIGNPDNYVFEISKEEFAFEIKTKIDLSLDDRIKSLNQFCLIFLNSYFENIPKDQYYEYTVKLITSQVSKLKEQIENRLREFVFDNYDPIESNNLWENKIELIVDNSAEIRCSYYNSSFPVRWDFFKTCDDRRIHESGTEEEKIGLRLIELPLEEV